MAKNLNHDIKGTTKRIQGRQAISTVKQVFNKIDNISYVIGLNFQNFKSLNGNIDHFTYKPLSNENKAQRFY